MRIKPTSVLIRYEGIEIDPQRVSEEQGVRAVLIGRVERRGNTLAVAVNLIDGRDNTLIWGQPYSKPIGDIFTLQKEIARQVVDALLLQLTGEETGCLAQSGTKTPEACQHFMIGQYHFLSHFELERAISFLESAISKDPKYQEAYRWLAFSYFQLARTQTHSKENYARAREYAEKCAAVDRSTVIGHEMRVAVLWHYQRKWQEAEQEYERAIELDPSFAVNVGFLDWMGRREESLAQIEKDLEKSDPLSYMQQVNLGYEFLWHGDYDRAIEQAKKLMALNPLGKSLCWILSTSYEQKGMEREAFEVSLQSLRLENASEAEMADLRKAFEEAGLEGARRLQPDTQPQEESRPDVPAAYFARLGDKDQAFEWLEKSWSSDLPLWGLENAPSCWKWDPLRSDPRFEKLLRKLNLPEEAIQRHLALQRN